MNLSGEGFQVKWTGEGGTRDRRFLTSECILSAYIENTDDESFLYDIFSNGDKEYFVRIYKNSVSTSNIWWYGYIQPSFDKFSNEPFPYTTNLIATDSIGVFKERGDDILPVSTLHEPKRINNQIKDFGSTMGLYSFSLGEQAPVPFGNYWFKTSIDWFRDGDTYQANDPFYSYYTTPSAYRANPEEKPNKYKKYDALDGALQTFNTVAYLSDGAYYFIQPNNLADNTTGDIRVYPYTGADDEVPGSSAIGDETTLLLIDGTTNPNKGTVLAGGSITFEPLFKGVSCDYINGKATFNVPEYTDLQSPFTAGQLQAADENLGSLGLYFNAYHREYFNESDVTLSSGYGLVNNGFRTTGQLTIKLGQGANTRYLIEGATPSGSAGLVWATTPSPLYIELFRGKGIGNSSVCNSTSGFVGSMMLNNGYDLSSSTPCNISLNETTNEYVAETNITFQALLGTVPIPSVSGDITIELDCTNSYWAYNPSPSSGTPNWESISTPSNIVKETVSNNINMTGSNTEALGGAVGLTYETTQSENEAFEVYDLGEIVTGHTGSYSTNFTNSIFNVKYNDGTSITSVTEGFRSNDTGTYDNILQLLTKEFLELQTEPLEVLQADIFSQDISPLKLVKYSINGDSNYKYYQFLGGTFSAQSETMKGEWYKINKGVVTVPDPPTPISEEINLSNNNAGAAQRNAINTNRDRLSNSLGTLSTAISANIPQTKVILNSTSNGKIYDNQKVLLCYTDGSNPLTLISNGGSTTSDTEIDLDGFTSDIDYPVGSLLLPLTYDLTNVIQGENLALGVTTTAIYLTPQQFHTTNDSDMVVFTRNDLGSVEGTEYYRKLIYATTFIPLGYKVKIVDIYASQNRSIEIKTCRVIDDYTTSQGIGTSNTPLTTSPWASVEGYYVILMYAPGATSDEIYGAKITIEAI